MPQHHFRSIWISDLHLGKKNLQHEQLLDFLLQTESEYLYLVGDIVDLLQVQKKWYWPRINNKIVQAVFEKARNGTKVFYIPGNHDQALRKFNGSVIHNIHFMNSVVHETVDGYRYLVMHGDSLDPFVRCNSRPTGIKSAAAFLLRWVNRVANRGKDSRSLSVWLQHQMKIAADFLGNFEKIVLREVAAHQVDGLICGHIHRAGIREIGHVLYSNSGDWVESCTALAENHAGRLGIVEWRRQQPLEEATAVKNWGNLDRNWWMLGIAKLMKASSR
jgi:UDP-2,3-diacylglucosamine pyrophosphatase LpxH